MKDVELFSGSAASVSAVHIVDRYLALMPADGKKDPLEWWNEQPPEYDGLRIIARRYLSVPASSTKSESVFSAAGRTITQYRARLHGETAASLLMIRENMHLLPEGDIVTSSGPTPLTDSEED